MKPSGTWFSHRTWSRRLGPYSKKCQRRSRGWRARPLGRAPLPGGPPVAPPTYSFLLYIPTYHQTACLLAYAACLLVYPSFERVQDQAVVRGLWKRNKKRIKRKQKVSVPEEGRAVLWTTIKLCLRLCPWYLECIVMYARYVCCHLVGTETEAELLVELLTSWTVKMQSSPDSFGSVRELGR